MTLNGPPPKNDSGRRIEKEFPSWELSIIAERESWRKEIFRPIYHIHKWWAKRLGSVFRGIILGALLNDDEDIIENYYRRRDLSETVILDPFMGSGTTIGEALKLGCRAIGKDINPVSYQIVKTALEKDDLEDIICTYKKIERTVSNRISDYYLSELPDGQMATVLYYFWVKYLDCPECGIRMDLFNSYIFSRHAYPKQHPKIQTLCPNCDGVNSSTINIEHVECGTCGFAYHPRSGNTKAGDVTCRGCGHTFKIVDLMKGKDHPPHERMYAKMILTSDGQKEFHSITDFDLQLYQKACKDFKSGNFTIPVVDIQPGYNTNQILRYNYRTWDQLFNDRQLLCLGFLADEISRIKNHHTKDVFACLFSGVLEFNNMFCSFKGEGTGAVRHMFSHHILKPEKQPLESNVWGTPRSSGSFSTLFKRRILKAIEYKRRPFEISLKNDDHRVKTIKVFESSIPLGNQVSPDFKTFSIGSRLYLACGDSSTLDLPDKTVDHIITDPPFFDNVFYSELADFFYVWLRMILDDDIYQDNTTRSEHEVQDGDPIQFARKLTRVFCECNRVLKDDGLLIFTYHHSKKEGWQSVLDTLRQSGFIVSDAHPIKSEMAVATPKAQTKEPINYDIILVCKKGNRRQEPEDISAEDINKIIVMAQSKIDQLKDKDMKLSSNDLKMIYYGSSLTILSVIKCDVTLKELFSDIITIPS